MNKRLKILILEDNATDVEIIQRLLKNEELPYEFRAVMHKEEFILALNEFHPDLIISDNTLPQFSATEALEIVNQRSIHIPFILVTGTTSEEFAVNIIKQGADDYVLKDRLARLPAAIEVALKKRKAEKELLDYKYALDQAAIISLTDQKGIINYVNENFCKISQYSEDELLGKDHRIVNSGYHPKEYIKQLWETIGKGNIWRGEFKNKKKDGSFYWADATIVPFLNKDGKPYQYLAIRTDISKRKKGEERQRLLSSILENTSDFVGVTGIDQRVLYLNGGGRKMIGNDELKDMSGTTIMDYLPERFQDFAMENIIPYAIEHEKWNGEIALINKASVEIPVSIVAIVLKTPDGKPQYISIIARDISSRKFAEEKVKESEIKYRSLMEQAPEIIIMADVLGKITAANESACHLIGYSKEEFNQLFIPDLFVIDGAIKDEAWVDKLEVQTNVRSERQIRQKNGVILEVEASGKLLSTGNILLIAHDITERKQMERQLASSENQYRRLFESAKDGILILDFDTGHIEDVNPYLLEKLGFKYEDIVGKQLWEVGFFRDIYKNQEAFTKLKQDHYIRYENLPLKTFDGKSLWVEFISNSYHVNDKKVIQCNIRDITERKIAEDKLLHTNDELRTLSSHLQSIREEERITIAREIHDELGQQITGLKMDVHNFNKHLLKKDARTTSEINDILELTDELVKSVRRISMNLRPPVLDDLGLVAALEWQAHEVIKRSNIKVTFICNVDDIELPLNVSTATFRIYQEILNNAVKHSNAHSVISRLTVTDTYLLLEVSDDGKGMVSNDLNKKSLGLVGIKERVYILNGKFEIKSDPGKGTQISINIPLLLN